MHRKHALIVSLILGLAVAAGGFAIVRTAKLGEPSAKASDAQLLNRERLLDRQQRALRRALDKRPPALPKVSRVAPAAPVVVTRSNSHGHHGHDDELEHEDDDD
jgi:hypothetical protein